MWVSCLSSLSPASSSSKVTRAALNRDFFGGAGVRDGSSSGRSTGRAREVKYQSQANNWTKSNVETWFYPLWWQYPSVSLHSPRYILLLHPVLSSCQVAGRRWQLQGRQRSGTAAALSGGPPQSLWAEDVATSPWGTQERNEQLPKSHWLVL